MCLCIYERYATWETKTTKDKPGDGKNDQWRFASRDSCDAFVLNCAVQCLCGRLALASRPVPGTVGHRLWTHGWFDRCPSRVVRSRIPQHVCRNMTGNDRSWRCKTTTNDGKTLVRVPACPWTVVCGVSRWCTSFFSFLYPQCAYVHLCILRACGRITFWH